MSEIAKTACIMQKNLSRPGAGEDVSVLLRRIGRIHTGAEAVEAVKQAQAAGFENISLDLIYGLPEQEMADLQEIGRASCRERV